MNERFLFSMYQQWQQDKDDVVGEWVNFVELASKEFSVNEDEVIRHLQKYNWFKWAYNEI